MPTIKLMVKGNLKEFQVKDSKHAAGLRRKIAKQEYAIAFKKVCADHKIAREKERQAALLRMKAKGLLPT